MALEQADKFFENGNYEAAITEYKRFLYFNPGSEIGSEILYKIGLSYRYQKKWSIAIQTMRKSVSLTLDDSLRDAKRIGIAITLIASEKYSLAEFELLQVANFSGYENLMQKAFFFLSVCYLYTYKWSEAQRAIDQYFKYALSPAKHGVDSLLSLSAQMKNKSPKLAKWLSTFIPGSGQIYGGDWGNGLNALALNSLTSYILFDALLEKRFLDVAISHITLFERYYRGNRYHAERIANLHNERMNRLFAQKTLNQLYHVLQHEN